MIINETEAVRRLNSPMNLMNRLVELKSAKKDAKKDAMSLFGLRPGNNKREIKVEDKILSNSFTDTETDTEIHRVRDSQSIKSSSQPIESLDNILEDHDAQIKLGLAHDRALDLLNRSVVVLSEKLDEVSASKLPSVISAASKTVESIRRERLESSKLGKDKEVHFHFYTPQQKSVSDYEIIDVQ